MHHIIPIKGMCDVSRDLLKFGETSDNISIISRQRCKVETVAMEN